MLGLWLVMTLASGPARVAVAPVVLDDEAKRAVGTVVDEFVLTAMHGLGGREVIGKDDLNALLGYERQRDLLGCDETRCHAELAGALDADELLQLKAAKVGEGWALTGKRLALRGSPKVLERKTESVSGTAQALLDALPRFVRRLYGASESAEAPCKPAECADRHQKACDAGQALGCMRLAWMLAEGEGIPKDPPGAAKAHGRACELGHMLGCNNLGWAQQRGLGVSKDLGQGARMFDKACAGGSAVGCTNLGYAYAAGYGVPSDARRAVELYTRACAGDDAQGCSNLGDMYVHGVGVAKDEPRGLELLRQGCKRGNAWGCRRVAELEGVTPK